MTGPSTQASDPGKFVVVERPTRTIKPARPRLYIRNGQLFPHKLDGVIRKMHPRQRFVVVHPALGPWTKGDVIERHVDLVGAHLPTLLALRAIVPTAAPAYKHPRTIAQLQVRARLLQRTTDAARAVAAQVKAPVTNEAVLTAPIPGVVTGKVTG